MAITGDLGMGIDLYMCVCVCDVKEEKNWFGGGCCDQDSTAGSCHSFDPFPPRIPPHKIKSLDCTLRLAASQKDTKRRTERWTR